MYLRGTSIWRLDCKTVVFFANTSDGKRRCVHIRRKVWSECKNGEGEWGRDARFTLEDHAYGAWRLPKLPKTTVLQSIWRPENSVNISNLLWLSRRLIISIENTSIYINSFPNAPTSKRAQNHDISIYFSTNSIVALCHAGYNLVLRITNIC